MERPGPQVGGPDVAGAPNWQPGDWWRWSFQPRDQEAFEATTVVASVSDGESLVGWGSVDEGLRAQFFHFVPHGPVSMTDLSWQAHGQSVTWLRFPLKDGATWEGGFWITPMAFTARQAGGSPDAPEFVVHGEGDEGGVVVDLVWSSTHGTFTHLEFFLYDETAWLVLDLLESGRGLTEPSHVMHLEDAIIQFMNLEFHAATQTTPPLAQVVPVAADVTHVSMGCYVGGAPGRYEMRFELPGAESYGCETVNAGTSEEPLRLDWGPVAAGDWLLSLSTLGRGVVFVELYLFRAEAVTPGAV